MHNNKVIALLRVLDRKEMTRFCEFVHSPYFNKHEKVRDIVAYLNGIYPCFTEKNCDRYFLMKKLWPREEVKYGQLAVYFTYIYRLLRSFLIQEQSQEDTHLGQLHLLQFLRQREQYRYYRKELKQWEKTLEEKASNDSDFFYHGYLFAAEADHFYSLQSRHRKDHSIQQKQDQLDRFFLAEKLRDACEMLVRSRILKIDYNTHLLEAALQEVEQHPERYAQLPGITIYARIYRLVERQEDPLFFLLKEQMAALPANFARSELQNFYNYLVHYCVERINQGETGFLGELLQIYKAQLERELIMENGQLSEWHYKNIVTTGLRLGEIDWVDHFIESYRERLAPQCRENAYAYNKASWCYATGDFDRVLDLLLQVEYKDIRYIQGVKALLLRTYYDRGEYEAFLSLAESFKQFIQRNDTLSDARRQGFRNLITFARRAFQLKMEADFLKPAKYKRELQRLENDIHQAGTIFNQSWLEEKMKELGTKLSNPS